MKCALFHLSRQLLNFCCSFAGSDGQEGDGGGVRLRGGARCVLRHSGFCGVVVQAKAPQLMCGAVMQWGRSVCKQKLAEHEAQH
jgi:hypothetical protein